jgi:inhibitor of cysteine peptidase
MKLITQSDHDTSVEVQKGDSVTVQLPENPTTGYRWSLDQIDQSALEPTKEPSFEAAGLAVGAGGGRTFTFVAKTPGESDLALNLRRPWEDKESARRSFRVKIQIHE